MRGPLSSIVSQVRGAAYHRAGLRCNKENIFRVHYLAVPVATYIYGM